MATTEQSGPKYPDVCVQLDGEDGNIFAIAGRCGKAMRRAGVPSDEIDAFYKAVQSTKSYDEALQTVMAWVDVC